VLGDGNLRNSDTALVGGVFASRRHGNRRLNFEGLGFGGFVSEEEVLRKRERCLEVRNFVRQARA